METRNGKQKLHVGTNLGKTALF